MDKSCNITQAIIEKITKYKSQRDEAMRQYQAAHGAVQAMEQLLQEIEKESKEENNNGK